MIVRVFKLLLGVAVLNFSVFAEEVPLTILHMNDLHSHYREEKGLVPLGGIARIATKVRQIRSSVSNSLFFDGGDWSEGHIYYTLDAGRSALEIMNVLGIDAAVVGNHDFLNGPREMLKLFKSVPPRPALLCANISFSDYQKKDPVAAKELANDFLRQVLPYKIFKKGGAKIAVIGVTTKEVLYDKFFRPVEIEVPVAVVRNLANRLKKEADLVIVISHNSFKPDLAIASLANVDIVVHSHDHEKYPKPFMVEKDPSEVKYSVAKPQPAVMIEAGDWGQYLGRLDILIDTETKNFRINPAKSYELMQIDPTIEPDPDVLKMVDRYEEEISKKFLADGNILKDPIAESKIIVDRGSDESMLGNLLADSYRDYFKADVAFESTDLTSMALLPGPLVLADFFNAMNVIYNPVTNRAWTLKTMWMTGDTLDWVINLMFMAKGFFDYSLPNISGMRVTYNPLSEKTIPIFSSASVASSRPLMKIEIGGKPIDLKKEYFVAMPQGIYEAIAYVEEMFHNPIPRRDEKDSGVELWRALATYVQKNGKYNGSGPPLLDSSMVQRGNRFVVAQSDVGIYNDDVVIKRYKGIAMVDMTFKNYGAATSGTRTVNITYDQTPLYYVDDPNPSKEKVSITIPAMKPSEVKVVSAKVELPSQWDRAVMRMYFNIEPSKDDPNPSNERTGLNVDALKD